MLCKLKSWIETIHFTDIVIALLLELWAFLIVNQNVLVVHIVVIIFEFHDATLENSILKHRYLMINGLWHVLRNLILRFDLGYLYTALEKMSSHDHCVWKKFSKILYSRYPLHIILRLLISFKIRISWTILDFMSNFFAALTSDVFELPKLILQLIFRIAIILVIFFTLMLAKFAPRAFFVSFTTAPPHFTSIFTLVSATTPIVIFLLQILLSALFAYFLVLVDLEPSIFEFNESLFHFFSFILHLFILFL